MKNYFFVRLICALLLFMFSFPAVLPAQNTQRDKVINGQVTDAKGEPLSGVNILRKGTTQGTVSDQAGKFSINANDSSILVFSFVGFTTAEIPVKGTTSLNVQL